MSQLIPPGAHVVDIGAGNGQLAGKILQLRPDLTIEGFDIVEWPDRQIKIQKFDGANIPLSDGKCDYCLISDVLHHCDDPLSLLREMSRVSSKGILVKDHIYSSSVDWALLCLMDWIGNHVHGIKLAFNYWTRENWKSAFTDLNLHEVEIRTSLSLYPVPFTWIFDRKLHFICLLEQSKIESGRSLDEGAAF